MVKIIVLFSPVGTNQKLRAFTDVLVTILVTKYEKNKKSPQKIYKYKRQYFKMLRALNITVQYLYKVMQIYDPLMSLRSDIFLPNWAKIGA
jgi:hypothetical protein